MSSYPITDLDRAVGVQKIEAPRRSRQLAHEVGNVVSPKHQPPLRPVNIAGTYFCQIATDRLRNTVTDQLHGSQWPDRNNVTDQLHSSQCPDRNTVTDQLHGSQCPDRNTVTDQLHGSQCPDTNTVTDQLHGSQCPDRNTVIDQLNGSQCPDRNTVTDQLHGSQCPIGILLQTSCTVHSVLIGILL